MSILIVIAFSLWTCGVATASTLYLSTAGLSSCNGEKTCSLTFTAVASGNILTITHVSCGIVTSGLNGGTYDIVLRSSSAGQGAIGDHEVPLNFEYGTVGFAAMVNSPTTFYVPGGDYPVIDVTANADIVATSDGGCLVSGTITK